MKAKLAPLCIGFALLISGALLQTAFAPAVQADDPDAPAAPQAGEELDEEELEDEPEAGEDENSPSFAERLIRRVRGFRATSANEKNHRKVKEAFRDVIKVSASSTVRILNDDNRVAYGTIVDADGFVVTKASELSGDVTVLVNDGRRLDADIVGLHKGFDLALLKVDANALHPVRWNADELLVGTWLATPGLGDIPIAIGVVSAAPRAIAPRRGILGIMLEESEKGPLIRSVMPGSGAEDAGLQVDDVVLEANEKAMENREQLIEYIRNFRPGDHVRLKVQRGDKTLEFEAVLSDFNQLAHGRRVEFQNSLGGQLSNRRAGFSSVLQHDTILQPNECGGPVLDLDGKAVGVNIARAGRVESFALPASIVVPLIAEMKDGKHAPPKSAEQRRQELSDRVDVLRQQVAEGKNKLQDLENQLKSDEAQRDAARQAADSDSASPEDRQALQSAQEAVEGTAKAVEQAKAELGKLEAELEKTQKQYQSSL